METRKDGHIVWEKVDRSHERDTFEKIAGLDAICFDDRRRRLKDSQQKPLKSMETSTRFGK